MKRLVLMLALLIPAPLAAQAEYEVGAFSGDEYFAMTLSTEDTGGLAWMCDGDGVWVGVVASESIVNNRNAVTVTYAFDNDLPTAPQPWRLVHDNARRTRTFIKIPYASNVNNFTYDALESGAVRIHVVTHGSGERDYEFSLEGLEEALDQLACLS